ncbi:alpha/beta hydrolase [Portibacter marinus]|uniref:alpha/beta hydrolase n=1 Tax=Portibacter marinus TaxID=2898660 RepID=UPI001F249A01|nr:alpha/beta hydrolase [Portibacter marinus]
MKLLGKIFLVFISLIAILLAIYLLGPQVKYKTYDNAPLRGDYTFNEIAQILRERNQTKSLKEGNQELIIWANDTLKTEYSFVYIHGFSASHGEGAPLHQNIAQRYGANLFLSRLPQHGLMDEDAFVSLTPGAMVDYAKEAVKIGKSIGKKVILISCSTGSTLSTYLASADPDIEALIMFSPNFEMHDQNTKILTKPWGLTLARRIKGGDYHEWNAPQRARPFWYHKYRLEGIAALQSLIETTMKKDVFELVEQPVFVGYYYKDESTRDFTISTEKIMEVENLIGTAEEEKVFKQYSDGNAHVFISPLFNPSWQKVESDVYLFLEEVLNMSPKLEEVLE